MSLLTKRNPFDDKTEICRNPWQAERWPTKGDDQGRTGLAAVYLSGYG